MGILLFLLFGLPLIFGLVGTYIDRDTITWPEPPPPPEPGPFRIWFAGKLCALVFFPVYFIPWALFGV